MSAADATSPRISVVVPAYNAARHLDRCLASLAASQTRDYELIVVDDGSTDATAAVAARHGARVVRLPRRGGPAAARNRGAAQARGAILVFLDSDVCARPDTVTRLAQRLSADDTTAAVFGSYDTTPADPGFVSQYKNLLHHYVHQTSRAEATTFWAGCGAMRRSVFEQLGGFDERYDRPCIEDIELGYRVRAAGHRIVLDPSIQVTHLKRWTFGGVLRSDVWDRGVPWVRLMLAHRHLPSDLNLAAGQRLSVALVYLLLGALGATCRWPAAWGAAGIAMLGLGIANHDLYRFYARTRGWWFALRALPLHWLYFAYCGAAVGLGLAAHAWAHWRTAVVLALGVAIHVGTAVLRLGDVVHPARMKDFAGVYAAAWAMCHGLSPYTQLPADLLDTLRVEQQLAVAPSPMLATPLWPWLFQPLTALSFPVAAWLWLVVLLALAGWSAVSLARIAGCVTRRDTLVAAVLVVTFGPMVLSLTLGQSSPLLLVAALAVGRALHRGRLTGSALALWGLSVAAKLFPALWAVAWPLLRHVRAVVSLTAAALVALATVAILEPSAGVRYAGFVGNLTWHLMERPDLDDQSLPAWVHRVGRPQVVVVHGMAAADKGRMRWKTPWAVEPAYLTAVTYALLGALGFAVAGVVWRVGPREPEAMFYLWVLYALLPVPHTMRYNHVLLLPAIAWLWRRGAQGRWYASAGYFLAALSRLTHVWAVLPAPWGPLTSGFGVVAVCVLGAGIARDLRAHRAPVA